MDPAAAGPLNDPAGAMVDMRRIPIVALFGWLLLGAEAVPAQPTNELLTNALDVLSLPEERARSGIPISIQGVVTVAQPDWGGRFFVQDATAGIFVENISDQHPVPGDLVRVTGVSREGKLELQRL